MLQRTPPDHDFEDDGEELGSSWAALAALAILVALLSCVVWLLLAPGSAS